MQTFSQNNTVESRLSQRKKTFPRMLSSRERLSKADFGRKKRED